MSNLVVGQIQGLSANGNIISVPSGHTIRQPGGVIQVVQAVKTDAFGAALSNLQWQDVTGMSVTITPKINTSKILILVDLKASGTQAASIVRSRLLRDSTPVYIGDAASNRARSMGQFYGGNSDANFYMAQIGGTFLDSPNTSSAITYKVQIGGDANTSTLYVNRTQGDRDGTNMDARGASSITVMEIAQ